MSAEQRNDQVAQMAGDLAEYIGQHIEHDEGSGSWSTDEDVDGYVIGHVQRLDAEQQRRMRAIATVLMGLTASALARAGTAPYEQEMVSDNPDLPIMLLDVKAAEDYDRG